MSIAASCHGADLRGGDQGGPNLLRSDTVLNDQAGELITPVIVNGQAGDAADPRHAGGCARDRRVHPQRHRDDARPGNPPPGPPPVLNVVVGDAAAGASLLQGAVRHVPFGDWRSARDRFATVRSTALQNYWISAGGGLARGGRGGRSRPMPVTVTPATGQKVEGTLVRLDDFYVVVELADGTQRTFRRNGRPAGRRRSRSFGASRQVAPGLHRQGHSQRDGISGDAEMTPRRLLLVLLLALPPIWLSGQSQHGGGLDPAAIRKPLSDSWPVYSGDYTGRRFSALKQVDRSTVKNLALAWVARLTAGTGAGPAPAGAWWRTGRGWRPAAGRGPPMIVGGVGTGEFAIERRRRTSRDRS